MLRFVNAVCAGAWASRLPRLLATLGIAAFLNLVIAGVMVCRVDAADLNAAVSVPESALDSLIGQTDLHFHRAVDMYTSGDADGAASEIRVSAGLIRLEAARAKTEDANQLASAATDLDQLADGVVNGNVPSRRDLDLAFAHADLALAAHYRSMANDALNAKDRVAAARWLKAAGDAVDQATAWTGHSPSGAQAEAQDQMHALQAKIRSGANWSYDEARKGIGDLGTQIQNLGRQMQQFGSGSTK